MITCCKEMVWNPRRREAHLASGHVEVLLHEASQLQSTEHLLFRFKVNFLCKNSCGQSSKLPA